MKRGWGGELRLLTAFECFSLAIAPTTCMLAKSPVCAYCICILYLLPDSLLLLVIILHSFQYLTKLRLFVIYYNDHMVFFSCISFKRSAKHAEIPAKVCLT